MVHKMQRIGYSGVGDVGWPKCNVRAHVHRDAPGSISDKWFTVTSDKI